MTIYKKERVVSRNNIPTWIYGVISLITLIICVYSTKQMDGMTRCQIHDTRMTYLIVSIITGIVHVVTLTIWYWKKTKDMPSVDYC